MAYSKNKRWWQQIVPCCPNCGSVCIYLRQFDNRYRCTRCNHIFAMALQSTPHNRPYIRKLRRAYSARQEKLLQEMISKVNKVRNKK